LNLMAPDELELVLEVDVVAFRVIRPSPDLGDAGAAPPARLEALLVRRAQPPSAGGWALPGLRLGKNERLDRAARRALRERTRLDGDYLEQLYTFDQPARDPRGPTISVAYFALLPRQATVKARPGRDVDEVRWEPAASPPRLAFDHRKILDLACERVAAKVEYAPLAFKVLPNEFTMSELREVHEALSGRQVAHENNFWRLMNNRWNLIRTGERKHGQGRPAALYRLSPHPDPRPRALTARLI
jgi:8-oxo-dGTP diphosphatase